MELVWLRFYPNQAPWEWSTGAPSPEPWEARQERGRPGPELSRQRTVGTHQAASCLHPLSALDWINTLGSRDFTA